MISKIKFPKSELHCDYTFNGGQAFRWKIGSDGKWIGVFAHRVWKLWQDDNFIFYEVYPPKNSASASADEETLLKEYLRSDESLSDLYKDWSKRDRMFEEAAKKFTGVRMLKQDPVEIIFTFICSSNNNITRIKSMVDKMSKFYGNEIAEVDGETYHDFPTVEKLAHPSVLSDLQKAAFGYRAKFIQQSANKIMEFGGQEWINRLEKLPYKEAKAELIKLPGIGAKVADCICLMSLNHLEAIPVDTHVFQIAARYYLPHLKTMKSVTERVYNEIGDHFRSVFGDYAGWGHSVLFCDELKGFKDETSGSKRKKSQTKENRKCSKN
ncbi:N-glycosylase/DNA lyase [Planococcus citri]|uniref:N-glycosylase/DNA lyase n=1 Tax=Planococcus citri TaxID=170843 RepID=UPI0031F974A4